MGVNNWYPQDIPPDGLEKCAIVKLKDLLDFYGEEDIIIIGYSYGGGAALELAAMMEEQGKAVDYLVTIDSVSTGRYLFENRRSGYSKSHSIVNSFQELPGNVKHATNIYAGSDEKYFGPFWPSIISSGILNGNENLEGALNIEGTANGKEANHASLMSPQRGDSGKFNSNTGNIVAQHLRPRPFLPMYFH